MSMELNEYIEFLYKVQVAQSNLNISCSVFSEVRTLGNYWELKLYRSNAEQMEDRPFYKLDFDNAKQMLNHMTLLITGAKLANGEEV